MREIIPTVVPDGFDDVVAAKNRYGGFSPRLHVDCSDGRFAPKKTWLPLSGEKLPDASSLLYEAHLMVENPFSLGVAFARGGAKRIIGHVEAFHNAESAREAFEMWRRAGAEEVGVAVLFDTSLAEFAPYVRLADFVHLMTIAKIGEQGQPFEPTSLTRILGFHARFPDTIISVDGGEPVATVGDLARAGAERFCIGAALAKAKDPAKEYERLTKAAVY